jgi:glutamate N-acetyltransferase/amino-acid N-acetyltransferase
MGSPYSEIHGGVTAAQGFVACGAHCGIKAGNVSKPDLALIFSREPAVAAATFTTNKVKAAPVRVSAAHIKGARISAIVANSGNANACTGCVGIDHAKRMARAVAKSLRVRERSVLVCSTGRIGVELPIARIEKSIATLPQLLNRDGSAKAARAIMTSDTFAKEIAVEFRFGRRRARIGGIAKGAGMINPNMATMLCFLTTDVAIGRRELQRALVVAVDQSFNRITVDGDMSTNDTVILLANGLAGNGLLKTSQAGFRIFQSALNYVTARLAQMIVEDGEGVSRFIEVQVCGAATFQDARLASEAVANSTLVKCAWYGGDPNWGRIMDALGYSGARMREEMVDIYYNGVIAVRNGMASKTPAATLRQIARKDRIKITIDLQMGSADYNVFTTDLTTRYVEFNKGE